MSVLLVLLLAFAFTPQAAGAMTVGEYRSALRNIRDDAATLEDERADLFAEAIDAALPADESVELGGTSLPVRDEELAELADDVREADTAAEVRTAAAGIEARSEALLDAIGTGRLVEVPEDREALESILSADDVKGGKTLNDLLIEWAQKVAEWLSRLLSGLNWSALPDGPGIDLSGAWPYVVGVAAAIGSGLLVYLVMRLVAWVRARRREPVPEDEIPVIPAAEDLPPDALGYAERLASAGRFREAVRALFGGAARRLVELGVISRTKTRTNGELLSDVRASAPGVAAELGTLAGIFESAWYGRRDPGHAGMERARAHYAAVIETVGRLKGGEA